MSPGVKFGSPTEDFVKGRVSLGHSKNLEVVPESQRELLRSRNTDIRAIHIAFASLDGSEWISASSEPFFEWLDALES